MIIGIDATQANREVKSGTEWYAFNLTQNFKNILSNRSDIEVWLYFRSIPKKELIENLPSNFKVRRLRWPFPYFWSQGRLSIEMMFRPPDILFCPAHTIPVIHPKKTFTTLHDIGFEDNPELYDRISLWYHRFSAKLAVRTAFHIFTISNYSKKRIIEKYHCPEKKISVISLGFDRKRFRPQTQPEVSPVLARYNLKWKHYIFFIGRLEPKKNIFNIVKAFESAKTNLKLVLGGRRINISEVEQYLIDKPELEKRVVFLDYVDQDLAPALYSGSKIFLFPTKYEGFGLPIIEAQACGVPVITSDRTSNPEVAGNGALLVDPDNVQAIAAAIRLLDKEDNYAKELILKGIQNVKKFDWFKSASLTLEEIISKGSGGVNSD